MTTRIAVTADIHLSDAPGTAQAAALAWALEWLQEQAPNLMIVAGDATAAGTRDQSDLILAALGHSLLRYQVVPGNSDLRSAAESVEVSERLTVTTPFMNDECAVLAFDSTPLAIPPDLRRELETFVAAAGDRSVVLICHHPLPYFEEEDRAWLESLLGRIERGAFIAGHAHVDHEQHLGAVLVRQIRGLDPDKASGRPPSAGALRGRSSAHASVAAWLPAHCLSSAERMALGPGKG